MDDDASRLIAALERDDRRRKRLIEQARDEYKMPSDIDRWLLTAEQAAEKLIPKLPAKLQDEFRQLINDQVRGAKVAIKQSDDDQLHMLVMLLHKNLEIIQQNIDLKIIKKDDAGRKKSAKVRSSEAKDKHQKVQANADALKARHPDWNKSDVARTLVKKNQACGYKFGRVRNIIKI